MLRPIPQEQPGAQGPQKSVQKSQQYLQGKRKKAAFLHLQLRLRQLQQSDSKIIENTGKQLMEYFKKAENVTLKELDELIYKMQKTVLNLQKKRLAMIRKKYFKNKKKRL